MILAVTSAKENGILSTDMVWYGIKTDGTKEQCYKTIGQSLYATSNSTLEKSKQLGQDLLENKEEKVGICDMK